MSNQALIFFDIDGTLLDHDKQLPPSTEKAIHQLQKDNHLIAIATGRGPFMYESLRQRLNIHSFVSYNGSYVVLEDEVIYTNPLNKTKLLELATEGLVNDHPLTFMTEEGMRANVENHRYINESIATLKIKDFPIYDPKYYEGKTIYQSLLFCSEGEEEYYESKYPEFKFVRWHPLSVDILPREGSKAEGIKKMAKALDIDENNVYAFGDGLNDLEMLKTVKNSVAMGNAKQEVKAVAKYVTDDVANDGLVKGLKMTGLI
ncbi:Cof-type HAD-IIB family hydrolase [Amphibacillus sp. MSJ-3]|uniref:Cof-type HAD-IIB family hydrolase n=1 Tax=Amphibacillus sp. MSJ-3 TaxID=2841505 RepID=UPI001C0F22BD|nr:Cof-type HAD-IIB family hydrolase [Amphibacillus sp. MSJ-3]MBU5595458.1 Cof-type HAD-IIB family hydrolase [Amphibacillus sp. MSJ-3]